MTVYFIGAGPGDPELITVKGSRLIGEADLVLYAGSLVPPAVVAHARPGARVIDSSPLNLAETHALIVETVRAGGMAARVHTGDPSLYGAMREQMRLLDAEGIGYEVVPGVTAAFAAAAAAGLSLTVPERSQTVILTRTPGRTPMPDTEQLRDLARHRCTPGHLPVRRRPGPHGRGAARRRAPRRHARAGPPTAWAGPTRRPTQPPWAAFVPRCATTA